MTPILAFDVYGTLIDTHGVLTELTALIGEQAPAFSAAWRDKQLEYSFRRGLMQNYRPFSVCTAEALEHTCARFGLELDPAGRQRLLDAYTTLPAFPDARAALARLQPRGVPCFAFSNGTAEAVEHLLAQAGIRAFFRDVISCDELRSFKPNPAVYAHFLRRAGASASEAWLISGNPFDVIGARSAGMRAAWVRRTTAAVYDPWGIEPDLTVADLTELAERI